MAAIKTKLHILSNGVNPSTGIIGAQHDCVRLMQSAASYVIDPDVLNLLKREDVKASLRALAEAGIARLPMPRMTVEFDTDAGNADGPRWVREFVLFEEREDHIEAHYAMLDHNNVGMVGNDRIRCKILSDGRIELRYPPIDLKSWAAIVEGAVCTGLSLCLLMLNTKGIEKQVVEVATLNKARAKRGKHAIPAHSVVHIGTIYRRDGTGVKYVKGETGRHMPMHVRQAHTRRQHFGPGREETKIIFIPLTIVNFDPNEPEPKVKRVIKV